MILTGESMRKETCQSATLSTTNRMWTGVNLNPNIRGEKLATNRLS